MVGSIDIIGMALIIVLGGGGAGNIFITAQPDCNNYQYYIFQYQSCAGFVAEIFGANSNLDIKRSAIALDATAVYVVNTDNIPKSRYEYDMN